MGDGEILNFSIMLEKIDKLNSDREIINFSIMPEKVDKLNSESSVSFDWGAH